MSDWNVCSKKYTCGIKSQICCYGNSIKLMIEDLTHALEKAAHEDNTQTGISTQKVY